jgi:LysR family transcriptional regulator, glycine cleavage system transcriptional activator
MTHLDAKLPPLRSLVAFEASARHASVTQAARELGISREAVSRHIRTLEDFLGIKLFQRDHGAIALTPAGAAYNSLVRECLEGIANATGAVRDVGRPTAINVSTTIALASFWLTPRLASFLWMSLNFVVNVIR